METIHGNELGSLFQRGRKHRHLDKPVDIREAEVKGLALSRRKQSRFAASSIQ